MTAQSALKDRQNSVERGNVGMVFQRQRVASTEIKHRVSEANDAGKGQNLRVCQSRPAPQRIVKRQKGTVKVLDPIGPAAKLERIDSGTTAQRVIAQTAVQRIIAATSNQFVLAVAALQNIVPVAGPNDVVAT